MDKDVQHLNRRPHRTSNEFMALKARGGVTFEAVIFFSWRQGALIPLMNPAAGERIDCKGGTGVCDLDSMVSILCQCFTHP